MKKYLYGGHHTIYGTEEIFAHKETDENGVIIDVKIYRVPISNKNKEGISYSLVYIAEAIYFRTFVSPQLDSERTFISSEIWFVHYIKDEQRIVGFDDCEGHEKNGNRHHKHIIGKIIPYEFVDEWKLLSDFNEEVEKVKRGLLQ